MAAKKKKKVYLVTGGAGMIGSALVKSLVKEGNKVKVVDDLSRGSLKNLEEKGKCVINLKTNFFKKDLTTPGVLDSILKGIDYVFHLADVVGGVDYAFSNQLYIFHKNILMNTNVVESARKSNIKGYIYVGTACSFPKRLQTGKKQLKEEQQYPADPESSYGWSKLMGEYEASLLHKEHRIPVAIFILHNVYGPSVFDFKTAQVIPSLIKRVIDCPVGQTFDVWGGGDQGRDFVHVDDVSRALLKFKNAFGKGIIQVGSGKFTTIKEVAELIKKISKKNVNIKFDESKLTGDIGRYANIKKAKTLLRWDPKTSLGEGISGLYEFME